MSLREPFIGSAALAAGVLTRHALRTKCVTIHHDVYLDKDIELTAAIRAKAAWLRSRGHGILAGFSASAMHGAKYIDADLPATIIDTNRRREKGLNVWAVAVDDDEVQLIEGMRVTGPARTAVDLACRYPVETAVVAMDALARATRLKVPDIEMAAGRHPGRHGLARARKAIRLVDPGAESPRETWLRLLVIRAGYPQPETQIPVYNEYGVLIAEVDLGWRQIQVALQYEGSHHRSPGQFAKDIRITREMTEAGWIVVRVTGLDTEATILRLLADAWARRPGHRPGRIT
jgi:hypothetical protein